MFLTLSVQKNFVFMKFIPFRLIFFLSSLILLSSCLGTNTPTATSTDASFVSLTFAADDSIPYLSSAVFTLVDKADHSLFYQLVFTTLKVALSLPECTFKK